MKLVVTFSRKAGKKPIIAQVVRDTGVLSHQCREGADRFIRGRSADRYTGRVLRPCERATG